MVKTYSRKTDGYKQLSANFKVAEFACKDGSDTILIDSLLVEVLQRIRDIWGEPITLNSAYRNEAYNTKIKGAKNSQHLYGTAADIVVKGKSPLLMAQAAEAVLAQLKMPGGVGLYDSFTHVDVRATKSRWKENKETGYKQVSCSGWTPLVLPTPAPTPVKTAIEITVDNAIADGVLADRAHWLGVLSGNIKANPEHVKTVFDRYHNLGKK